MKIEGQLAFFQVLIDILIEKECKISVSSNYKEDLTRSI